jgi:hypothetical protein
LRASNWLTKRHRITSIGQQPDHAAHAYRTLGLVDASVTDAQIIDAMIEHAD